MRRLNAVVVSGGIAATLLAAGCGEGEPISGPDLPLQAKPAGAGLKVTPPMISLTEIGGTVTLTASSSTPPIEIVVSTPACVSVALRSAQQKQSKYTVTAIAAGSCTLTVTDGATGQVLVPVTVAPSLVGSTLTAGLFHSCGLDANGTAWCWGLNTYGQLGNTSNIGIFAANPTPLPVAGGLTFVSLTAGFNHTCGVTPAGAAYCWGANYTGQLGNLTNSGVDTQNPTPLPVDGGLAFAVLEAGNDHTCGITTQGQMYCWGFNALGQLGTTANNGTGVPNPTPALVGGGLTFLAVGAGVSHTCGLATGGVVYCWGENFEGQLGTADGVGQSNVPHPTPTPVQGLPPIASLAAGSAFNCALTSEGAAWCWGSNPEGQLGAVTSEIPNPTPVAVDGGLSFASLGAGSGHTCGLTADGTIYCWGGNVSGQLGTITNFGTATPTFSPVAVSGLTAAMFASNGSHTCAVTAAGQAWCWGANRYGQLGTTTNNDTGVGVPTPATVLGGIVFAAP